MADKGQNEKSAASHRSPALTLVHSKPGVAALGTIGAQTSTGIVNLARRCGAPRNFASHCTHGMPVNLRRLARPWRKIAEIRCGFF